MTPPSRPAPSAAALDHASAAPTRAGSGEFSAYVDAVTTDSTATAGHQALPSSLSWAVWGVITGLWAVLDQATKALAIGELELADRHINAGPLVLRVVRNDGPSFLAQRAPGLVVIVTVVVVLLVIGALRRTDRLSYGVAYGLVTGGAIGNVIDRVSRSPGFPSGDAIAIIDPQWWPMFNIADVAIVAGVAMIGWLILRTERHVGIPASRAAAEPSVRPTTA